MTWDKKNDVFFYSSYQTFAKICYGEIIFLGPIAVATETWVFLDGLLEGLCGLSAFEEPVNSQTEIKKKASRALKRLGGVVNPFMQPSILKK